MMYLYFCVFLFKQKTAYEMRISDWSSDVCSSDLLNKWPRMGMSPKTGTLSTLRDSSRDRKPANTRVWPDCTLNSVAARRVLSDGPLGTDSELSTELTSTSMRERTAPLRSICGVMRNDTP